MSEQTRNLKREYIRMSRERQAKEHYAELILNRIALLESEKQRVAKRAKQAKEKAQAIMCIKQSNEERLREKER